MFFTVPVPGTFYTRTRIYAGRKKRVSGHLEKIAYPNPNMIPGMDFRVAQPDGQNGIDNPYNATRTDCFGRSSSEIINNVDYSTTYSYEFAAPEHLGARR